MKTRIAIALSLLTMLAVPLAYGQSSSPVLGTVDIPFKFLVGKKEMPAGKYDVLRQEGQASQLLVRNRDGKSSVYVPVRERLAEMNPSQKHGARVVFDTVGKEKFLSEFWPADHGDGYLLGITKGEEKHEVVEQK